MEMTNDLKLILDVNETTKVVHTPMDRIGFEMNYKLIGLAYQELQEFGTSGEQVAALVIKDLKNVKGQPMNSEPFVNELINTTVVHALRGDERLKNIPVAKAIHDGLLSQDDWAEVKSQIIFFTCVYWMVPKAHKSGFIQLLRKEDSITFLASTDSTDSSQTSTPTKTSVNSTVLPRII